MSSILLSIVMVFSLSATAFAQSPSTQIDANKATYEITINNKTIELQEGQKAQVPIIAIQSNSGIQPQEAFPGPAGTLYLWPEGGKVHYNISMSVPATSFVGIMMVTDLTSGLSGGYTPVAGFTGAVLTSNWHEMDISIYIEMSILCV